MSDAELILIGGALLACGIAAAMVADRVRVPGLVLFLFLGMLVGEDVIGVEFDDVELTRTLGTIGLILILFEGGLTAGWKEIRPVIATAIALAVVGTIVTAAIAAVAAAWLFDLGTLEALIIGSAVAATDSAAIFAVLRGSTLRKRIARSLEGESGFNDPIALLLVTGFIAWIEEPGYGALDMIGEFGLELAIGAAVGGAVGVAARWAFVKLDYPTPGLYPVASIATVALSYGLAEVAHGSGFLAVYLTGLGLGSGYIPARMTVTSFHQGVSWVSQIALFFMLGLLVDPSELGGVAAEGLILSAVLIFVARPVAAVLASSLAPFRMTERLMLGWAGLRGAIPIWLATFPVIAGVSGSELLFNVVFFVVLTSTLIQGFTFDPLAARLGLTTTEPALPQPLVESGVVQELGADIFVFRVGAGDAVVGRMVKDLGLPRQSLVSLIARGGEGLLPRGSTQIEQGDELHVMIRRETQTDTDRLIRHWREGPIEEPLLTEVSFRGSPQIFSVRPTTDADGDTGAPTAVAGIPVARVLRNRPDQAAALATLSDGRFAVTGPDLIALGGRRLLARWCTERAERPSTGAQERSWLQEAVGVLNAPS